MFFSLTYLVEQPAQFWSWLTSSRLTAIIWFGLWAPAFAEPAKEIVAPQDHSKTLVIFTGHEQVPSQAEIFRGFTDEQYQLGIEDFTNFAHEVYTERVDAYRNFSLNDYDLRAAEILSAYQDIPQRIVAEGNAAQALANRIAALSTKPLEILSVNTSQYALPGYSKAELFDLPSSLETIANVLPRLQTLFVIAPASRATEVRDIWEFDYAENFSLEILDETLSIDQLLDAVAQGDEDSAVLWVGRSSHLLSREGLPIRIIKQLADLNQVPVFGMQSSLHKAGAAGGVVTDAEELGRRIARLAHNVESVESVERSALTSVQFDYQQSQRWQLDFSNLDVEPYLFNEPEAILSQTEILEIVTAATAGTLLIFGFVGVREYRNNQQRKLHQKEVERLNAQLHRALTMSQMVLFEENVATGEAWFILPPSRCEGAAPYVGAQRLAATDPEYRPLIEEALGTVGQPVEFPLSLPGWDRPKWVRNQVLDEYLDLKGQLIRIQVSQDLTESYESQQSLAAAHKETEASLKQLEAASEKQKQLFAVVGHELRTPTASLNMMLEAQESEGSTAYAQDIRATAAHLLGVLDDLRSVVEPELIRSRAAVRARPFEVVERSVTPLREMLSQRGIRFSVDSDAAAGEYATFDQRGLRQVVTNLVKNAAIHSGARRINVHVAIEQTLSESQTRSLNIAVHDDGKGITAHMRERIFNAFERADSKVDGTGLGLHICREIIQANSGDLWVEDSTSLGGAVFQIRLPIEEDSQNLEQTREVSLSGKRLLIVEDNLMLRKLTENIVKGLGAECVLAENGRHALALMGDAEFDLIVTDIFMPELDGYGFVEAVRAEGNANPIVGVTAATVGDETDRLLEAGANLVISKPVTKESLQQAWAHISRAMS